MQTKILIFISLVGLFLTGCKPEPVTCGDYEVLVNTGTNNNGQQTGNCEESRVYYAGNYSDGSTTNAVTAHTEKNKMWVNNLWYLTIDIDNPDGFDIVDQWYDLPPNYHIHILSGGGSFFDNKMSYVIQYIDVSGNTVTQNWTGTKQ